MATTWTSELSVYFGEEESAVRLIIAMLAAYPISLVHAWFIRTKPAVIQHLYFVITGVLLAMWSVEVSCALHGAIAILFTKLVMTLGKGSFASTIFIFGFHLVYLLIGYYLRPFEDYVIDWRTPQCVLCLRLIAIAIDYYDGQRPEEEQSAAQKANSLKTVPSLLEMFSHVFHTASYFTGPQFNMARYLAFIKRNLDNSDVTGAKRFGLTRLIIGLIYLVLHVVGGMIFPFDYVLTAEFANYSFWKKHLFIVFWGKTILAKYIAVWLIAEGSIVMSGLGYNGEREDGSIRWNGMPNVRLRLFESATRFQHIIDSFNINTNAWCMHYVYKRMRFLNNKMLSQVVTLLFLALWHGWHSGYYVTFFYEFIAMNFEKQFMEMWDNSPKVKKLLIEKPLFRYLTWICGKLYVLVLGGHCFAPFALLKSSKYIPFTWNTGCIVLVTFGTWPLWRIPVKMILAPEGPKDAFKKKE